MKKDLVFVVSPTHDGLITASLEAMGHKIVLADYMTEDQEKKRGYSINTIEPILITNPYPLSETYPPYASKSYKRNTNRTPKKKKRK